MNQNRRNIDSKTAARVELTIGHAFSVSDSANDEGKFRQVREELNLFCPDTLQKAVPYILIGFLRFGITSIDDEIALKDVIEFLDMNGVPRDERYESRESWKEIRRIEQSKREAVSQFSESQGNAIRIWLETMLDFRFIEFLDSKRLNSAIAYWSDRKGSKK
jgi:hypothetical protein